MIRQTIYLRVTAKNKDGVGALGVVVVDGGRSSLNTRYFGRGIAVATTAGLATASGVVESLRCGTGVGVDDGLDDSLAGTVSSRSCGLAGTEDVN